jgi:hypothetical protein
MTVDDARATAQCLDDVRELFLGPVRTQYLRETKQVRPIRPLEQLVAVPREPHPDLGQRRIARVPDTTLRRNRRPRRTQIRPDLVETVKGVAYALLGRKFAGRHMPNPTVLGVQVNYDLVVKMLASS